jgi:hypothetical protein
VVLRDRQEMIDDVEPLGPGRIVDPGNLHQLLIFEPVAKQSEDVGDAFPDHVDRDLADLVLGGQEGLADRGLDLVDQPFADRDSGEMVVHGQREPVISLSCLRGGSSAAAA